MTTSMWRIAVSNQTLVSHLHHQEHQLTLILRDKTTYAGQSDRVGKATPGAWKTPPQSLPVTFLHALPSHHTVVVCEPQLEQLSVCSRGSTAAARHVMMRTMASWLSCRQHKALSCSFADNSLL